MSVPASVTYHTRFGDGWVAFEGDAVVATGLPGSANPYREAARPPRAVAILARRLADYWMGGALPAADQFIEAASRTDLDRHIYTRVAAIPAGESMSYRQVAAAVGRPRAARAVGAAMAANRYAPIIPCHRVVGSDGSLRGYAGGLEMKRFLLDMEAGRSA